MDSEALGKENMEKRVMRVPNSPDFLKPKPIRLKKRTAQPTSLPFDEVDLNTKSVPTLIKTPKIKNPFRRNANKRKREQEEIFNDDSNSLLWKQVNRISDYAEEIKGAPSPVVPSMLDESALSSFADDICLNFKPSNEKTHKPKNKVLPVDWSLKTKIRFTSSIPFPSRGSFRTFEEVNGTIGFVRCLYSGEADSKSSDVHSSLGAKFFQHCLVWMYPNMPWLNLFPRNHSLVAKANSSTVLLDSIARESLHSSWCNSFRSLYQLVRLYQCPYFYMCAPNFTVLFRCAGTASIPVIHALITPTTKGFRKALTEEGISFTMPLYNCKDSGDTGFMEDLLDDTPDSADYSFKRLEEYDVDPIGDEHDEPNSWLEHLGLSQDNFPSLHKQKRQDDSFYKVDHKPESLVYIEDSETQALVNFLLNSQFCTSKIGPMAGVPPTLLAPTAFLGATLETLKIRHGKIKTEDKGEMESIEITGPLLPNTVHSLCSLFSTTQESGFSVVLSSHNPTTSFSMVNPQSPMLPCIFAKNNLTDCGLPEAFVNQMCSKTEEFAFSNIKLEDGLFSWN